jgi:hypothetical protein
MRRRHSVPVLLAVTTCAAAVTLIGAPGTASALSGAPTFVNYAAPSSFFGSGRAGEPSLGVNGKTGAMMYQAGTSTLKLVVDAAGAATWTDVTPPLSVLNIDPILATDRVTGRTFAGGLDGECSALSYSDNDGGTWTPMGNACAGVIDHESIGSGPYSAAGLAVPHVYNRAVYYCAQNGTDACATSTDGGLTFGAPIPVLGACGSLHGHVKVSADGTAYLPNSHCGGKAGGGISTNNGLTWNSYTIPASDEATDGFDPSVGTTHNTVYESWEGANHHPYVAKSNTHGSVWTTPYDLGASLGVVNATFQSVVAGDNGRAAVAFLGSTTAGNPFDVAFPGVWDLYVAHTYDGGATWTTTKATTDPVQRGWMCAGGTTCNSGRNLLDFMDVNVTKDGRVAVGYADGCIGACAQPSGTRAQSTSAYATVAYQSAGKGLYAAFDTP